MPICPKVQSQDVISNYFYPNLQDTILHSSTILTRFCVPRVPIQWNHLKSWILGNIQFQGKILFFFLKTNNIELIFSNGGNAILGSGYSIDGQGLLFSVTHGMITIQPSHQPPKEKTNITLNDSILAEKTTKLSESLNLSVSQAGLDNLTMSESKKDQLKAAFLLFCKREFNQATGIVEEMFPLSEDTPNEPDSSLDRLVVSMSADLIDDFPASDPR